MLAARLKHYSCQPAVVLLFFWTTFPTASVAAATTNRFPFITSSTAAFASTANNNNHNMPKRPRDDGTQYFLFKSEPDTWSIQDMAKAHQEDWDGVRNYQARNIMRSMKVGDQGLFYHSSCKEPAIVGQVQVVEAAKPDYTAWDPQHDGHDPKSTQENNKWDMVRVQFVKEFPVPLTLKELKEMAAQGNKIISGMVLLSRGRLSVQPVTEDEWNEMHRLLKQKGDEEGTETTAMSTTDKKPTQKKTKKSK